MNKLSSEQVAQVLHDAEFAIRSVTAERDAALVKIASIERRQSAEKVASVMHSKGLELDQDHSDLADHLEKEAVQGKLPEISRAVDLIAPNMSIKTASLTNDKRHVGAGASDLESFLIGDVG